MLHDLEFIAAFGALTIRLVALTGGALLIGTVLIVGANILRSDD